MSLVSKVIALGERIATEINELRSGRGVLEELTTNDKTNIVNAINEINNKDNKATMIKTTQMTVGAEALPIPAEAVIDRKSILVYNAGTTDVYLGSSTVTATTGQLLKAGASIALDLDDGLYGITASGNTTLNINELS